VIASLLRKESASPDLDDQAARVISDFADGIFLRANLVAAQVVSGRLPSDPAALAQKLRELQSQPLHDVPVRAAALEAALERSLDSLGVAPTDVVDISESPLARFGTD
jgi:hypothetical protein